MYNKYDKLNMSSYICVNSITVILGEGNDYEQAVWKEVMLRFSRADVDTLTEIPHVSADTLRKRMYVFKVFLISPHTCLLGQRDSRMFLSVLFRNQKLTCFKWESIQVCLDVLEVSIAILKILNTVLLLNYVACSGVVQCFPQLKKELRIQIPMPAHPQNGTSSSGQHFFHCRKAHRRALFSFLKILLTVVSVPSYNQSFYAKVRASSYYPKAGRTGQKCNL